MRLLQQSHNIIGKISRYCRRKILFIIILAARTDRARVRERETEKEREINDNNNIFYYVAKVAECPLSEFLVRGANVNANL